MNWVKFADVESELFGLDVDSRSNSLRYIQRIQEWLGIDGAPANDYPLEAHRVRVASSLTTRTEGVLFGLSIPRFCVRLYLDENHNSFLNLRRSALFADRINLNGGWAQREAKPGRRIEGVKEPQFLITIDPPEIIADSALAVPKRFASKYQVLSADLHSTYGDAPVASASAVASTPFVQHSWITGLCSHAVVFMAATLLQDYARSVHGLSEIAALIRPSYADEILIAGLSPRDISDYFSNAEVALCALNQHSPTIFPWGRDSVDQLSHRGRFDHQVCFSNALRSYVLSGMPIIKYVDADRLHGKPAADFSAEPSIYGRNAPGFKSRAEPGETPSHHCVLVIGCSQKSRDEFLIHDPGGMPYLEATSSQLMNASGRIIASNGQSREPGHFSRCHFQPVTPGKVQMPLHSYLPDSRARKAVAGLYRLTIQAYEEISSDPTFPYIAPKPDEYLAGEFRLTQPSRIVDVLQEDSWSASILGQLPDAILQEAAELQRELTEQYPDHWFWIQRFAGSCWVWDAQKPPPLTDDYGSAALKQYFVAVISCQGHLYFNVLNNNPEITLVETDNQLRPVNFPSLGLSLITSFNANGLDSALSFWPNKVAAAELYAFMQNDVRELLFPGRADLSAVQAMAQLHDAPQATQKIAIDLAKRFTKKGLQIRGFATFIPELLDRNPNRQDLAKRALVFLVHLASELQGYETPHPARVIEMVGGSLINGVLPVIYNDERSILANRKLAGTPDVDLLDRIRDIVPFLSGSSVRLAIEAEPGPLFAFSAERAIDALVAQIESMEGKGDLPRGVVGLNLDVGHWMLSGISPTKLRSPSIAERVFNVHLSDHSKCHTGDSVLGAVNELDLFREWVREIRALPQCNFDGRISVEFECAKSQSLLQDAVDNSLLII